MRSIRLAAAVVILSIALGNSISCRAEGALTPQGASDQHPRPKLEAPSATPPSVTVIDAVDAHGILGRDVRSPANEDMGRIVDVIVDRSGSVLGSVIDFGGFLGVGSRKIVVEWSALHFWNVADTAKSITLELTRDQVKAAPEYKEEQPIVLLGASGSLEPLRYRAMPAEK
jgi:hypothetical protein